MKRWQPYKRDSVSSIQDFYHLSGITVTCYLYRPTLQDWASNPLTLWTIEHPWFIWPFNAWGLPPQDVAILQRELLPHVFTLVDCWLNQPFDGSFLWHYLLSLYAIPSC